MNISDDTKAVVEYLDKFAGGLRKKNDMMLVLEICATFDGALLLNKLIFSGKSVWNLSKTLRRISPDDDGAPLIQKEMLRGVGEMKEFLTEMILRAEDADKKRFDDIYFPETRGALKNLVDLAHDLGKFKDLQSDSKRQG
jgi:hypothetical protein